MKSNKGKMLDILAFCCLFLMILNTSAESAEPEPGAWYSPGRWVTRTTVPGDVVFPAFDHPTGAGNQLAVTRQGVGGGTTEYISGFFSPREEFKGVADTLVGWNDFTEHDLDLVKQVRSGKAGVGELAAARIAVAHFIAAVTHYLGVCNGTRIPATPIPEDLADPNTANLNVLKERIIARVVNSIMETKGHSEMALMVDIIQNRYADSHLIVRSKLDMCSRCETGLSSIGERRHQRRPPTDVIPYEIFVGGENVYTNDPHPNGNRDQGYSTTRAAPRHDPTSLLFKVSLAGTESHEAMPYP